MNNLVGVIRVLTTDDPELLGAHGRIIETDYGLPTITRCIPDQPKGIYDDETERIALPKIVALGPDVCRDAGPGMGIEVDEKVVARYRV